MVKHIERGIIIMSLLGMISGVFGRGTEYSTRFDKENSIVLTDLHGMLSASDAREWARGLAACLKEEGFSPESRTFKILFDIHGFVPMDIEVIMIIEQCVELCRLHGMRAAAIVTNSLQCSLSARGILEQIGKVANYQTSSYQGAVAWLSKH